MNKFFIFLSVFLAYTFYKIFDFLELTKKNNSEIGMSKCSQLNLWNTCIQSQIQYKNYYIISTCNKCDCLKNGASFHSLKISSQDVQTIQIDSKIDKNFIGRSMSVFDDNLFVVNEFNNTVMVYEISITSKNNIQQLSLSYFYSIPVQTNYKLDSILALHTYEMIATVQNKTAIYNGTSPYMKLFYDFLSYFGLQEQSFVLYLRNDIYDKYYDIKPVVGSDASKLSGITFDKEYRVFIGRPLEKAVGVYKYRGYKNWGVELMLTNITYVKFPVQEITYSKSSNELILTGTARLYNNDQCHGSVSRLQLSTDNKNFQLKETLQTNRKICGMSTAMFENSIYYLGSKTSEQYIKCEEERN